MAQTPLKYYAIPESVHEDLLDEITNISPTETPFLSMCGASKSASRIHMWPTDTLEHPSASGASDPKVAGFEFDAMTLTGRVRLTNYVETQAKEITVEDDLDEYMDMVGTKGEFNYQLQKKMKEMALTLEYRLWSAATGVSGAAATAAEIKAIIPWITTNVSTATADRAISRALMDGVMQDVWEEGGNPDYVFCGPARKTGLSGIIDTTFGERQLPSEGGRVVQTVDIYEGSFGVVTVKPSRYIADDSYAIIEMGRWRIAWGIKPKLKPIGKDGDRTSAFIKATFTLEARAENANGLIEDIS